MLKNYQQSVKSSVILKNRHSPPYKTTEEKKNISQDQKSHLFSFKVKNKLTPDIKYYKL